MIGFHERPTSRASRAPCAPHSGQPRREPAFSALGLGTIVIASLLLVAGSRPSKAQVLVDDSARRAMASRREIDSLARLARVSGESAGLTTEQRSALQRYAADAQRRLDEGDFQPGDRIIVDVSGDSTVRDTFTVQPSRVLLLPNLPPIPLRGVLRSELRDHLAAHLREFVKDSLVRASPLLLVGILGEVAHPGYYRMSLETSLGDALMLAGGPTHDADLTRMVVRRGNRTLIASHEIRNAMVRRMPLAQLGVDDGDELLVAGPRTRNWSLVLQVAGLAAGLLVAFFATRRR